MNLKNKILIISILFVFVILCNNSSLAYTTSEYNEVFTNTYSDIQSVGSFYDTNGKYYILGVDASIPLDTLYKYYIYTWYEAGTNRHLISIRTFTSETNYENSVARDYVVQTYYFGQASNGTLTCHRNTSDMAGLYNGDSTMYTDFSVSCDIYNDTGNGLELVFQEPPVLEVVMKEAQKKAGEVTQATLTKELAELVPVGVIILAAMTTVSLLAYWNFWKK